MAGRGCAKSAVVLLAILISQVVTFHSIPFAAPPVGELRFRPPIPPTPWTGVKDASFFAPMCPQIKIDGDLGLGMDEDCLYLDVYTPYTTDTELLPVMFWIFGGMINLRVIAGRPSLTNESNRWLFTG